MIINKIVTLANASSQLMFVAMERSLRATGCDIPLYVIPYDDNKFDLPPNSFWLEEPEFYGWIDTNGAHRMMRKYLPLILNNYQYLDTDAIFLQNPATALAPYEGFVACCTEWNKPEWTVTPSSQAILTRRWSTWQKEVFCAGQYACDRPLYNFEELRTFAQLPENREACLEFAAHDQPGTNLFVLSTDVPRINLTLPPVNMESTWAGDYNELPSWDASKTKPYVMHYAGGLLYQNNPLNTLFLEFLTKSERVEWEQLVARHHAREKALSQWPVGVRVLNRLVRLLYPKYYVQPVK
jgi:hypothetical protein